MLLGPALLFTPCLWTNCSWNMIISSSELFYTFSEIKGERNWPQVSILSERDFLYRLVQHSHSCFPVFYFSLQFFNLFCTVSTSARFVRFYPFINYNVLLFRRWVLRFLFLLQLYLQFVSIEIHLDFFDSFQNIAVPLLAMV